jgi:AAA domain/Bifunctional DNA primase/polymerase, N-terminal/IclR helix-turn-helix domain
MAADEVTVLRLRLLELGYSPIPLFGKEPPIYGKNNQRKGLGNWQQLDGVTCKQIEMWSRTWPDATNTGALTRLMPTLDLDILNEAAARAVEDYVREHYEERGHILTRIGRLPKRAIPFRTEEPFSKIVANVVAPNGSAEKLEFLGAGQQVVVAGIHPETKQPYRWFGGEPGQIAREDLPYIRGQEAHELVETAVEILVRDFGYTRAPERPRKQRKRNGTGQDTDTGGGAADWQWLFDNIRAGEALHDSLRDLAAKLVASGMGPGAAVNFLRGLMESSSAPHDARWRERYAEIPRLVDSGAEKRQTRTGEAPPQPGDPAGCANTIMTMHFAPIKYVIPGIVVEGLTLFAGKPKIGKSWLLLHAAVAVATGGFTLGQIHCLQGDVLYCALEDNKRRVKSRLSKLVAPNADLSRLFFYTYDEMARLSQGGLDTIRNWLKSVPHPRMVIIDTLAMVRSAKKKDESSYDADYNAVLELRGLASEFGVAIIVVHHLRKADADDAFDTVSGTLGLTGAPDSILILKYDSSGIVVLHGRGRDLAEIETAMSFNREGCTWQVAGDARDLRRSTERAKVLDAIKEAGEPIGPNTIASMVGMKAGSVRMLLQKLAKEGVIERVGYGKYQAKQLT